jgi:AraC-like DNA-binding protein
MADRLEALLTHFSVRAEMFHSGPLCGVNELLAREDLGQLHLVKDGPVEVTHAGAPPLQISEPSLLLYPRPLAHRFVSDATRGAQMACANLKFTGGAGNPVTTALPACICLPLAEIGGAGSVLPLLFEEAFNQRCGRRALVDRLFEVVLIQVLRHLMESGEIRSGMLAGLGHPKLRHALIAMHETPAREWSLEDLADAAGMSRSGFADVFREIVGSTPGAYLQGWRISVAQRALSKGRPMKLVAIEVGYGSEAAFSRAFKAHSGVTPSNWRRAQRTN